MKHERLIEEKISSERKFQGHILQVDVDTVRLSNGNTASREVVRHSGGVCVLALDEEKQVTLVEQFRYPLGRVILELPAGKLDKAGEGHEMGAIRELKEETGLVCGKLTYLGYILVSPGYCDEALHMYLAEDLTQEEANPDEDEFVEVVKIPFDTLVEKVMSGEIEDGKTVATVLKVKGWLS